MSFACSVWSGVSRRLFTAFTHTCMCTNTCMCSIFLHSEMQRENFFFFFFFFIAFHMPTSIGMKENGHYRWIKPVHSGGNLHFPRWQHTWTDLVHSSVVLSVLISRCSCHAVVCYDRIYHVLLQLCCQQLFSSSSDGSCNCAKTWWMVRVQDLVQYVTVLYIH